MIRQSVVASRSVDCQSHGGIIPAMMQSALPITRKTVLSPIQTRVNLYLMILIFGGGCFLFGIYAAGVARETGRGDPYHVLGISVAALVTEAVCIVVVAYCIRSLILRLTLTKDRI